MIKVMAAIFGGERFEIINGQLVDKGAHLPGFSMDHTGKLKASGAEISGHIEADSGTLNNITIRENSLFQGNITSGPLVLSDSNPVSGIVGHNVGADAQAIYDTERERLNFNKDDGKEYYFNVIGTYDNKSLVGIGYLYEVVIVNSAPRYKNYVFGYFSDNSKRQLAYKYYNYNNTWDNITLTGNLSIQYVRGGKTFKLIDLPDYNPHSMGAIYRNSSGQLCISLG